MIYIYCIPGTVVRMACYAEEQPQVNLDFSVWKLLSIVKPDNFKIMYTSKEKASVEAFNN